MTLDELAIKYGTDKSSKGHGYCKIFTTISYVLTALMLACISVVWLFTYWSHKVGYRDFVEIVLLK